MGEKIWERGEFLISTEKSRLDVVSIFTFLSKHAYWCKGIPEATVRRALDRSLSAIWGEKFFADPTSKLRPFRNILAAPD